MTDQPSDSPLSLPLAEPIAGSLSPKPSTIEEEMADLFEHSRDRLLRYLYSFGLQFQDGEEVIQEVFLALFLHLQKGGPRTSLRGWLFRVAHNLALKRRMRTGGNLEHLAAPDGDVLDPAPNPEEEAAGSQQQRRLLAVLRALPEQDRRCLALRAEGLRYREIAAVLGISLGSVSFLLSRSLARLARANER
jgi:RNA polymerase sigma-70 factor (ECF subfamily)